MIVVVMTNYPPKLRGDLSKWLIEINTGVYVGQVNARVREALWKRICENISSGQAVMVFSTNNEQHMDFYVHNTSWKPVDYDGIKLMMHPERGRPAEGSAGATFFSNAARQRMNRRRRNNKMPASYVLLDIETTGLSTDDSEILEIGLIEVESGAVTGQYSYIIKVESIPENIVRLTGIDMHRVETEGGDLKASLEKTFEIIEEKNVLIYNSAFDLGFLQSSAKRAGLEFPYINVIDVYELVKKKITDAPDHKLETAAVQLGINAKQKHRALDDCLLMNEVYLKLNEK